MPRDEFRQGHIWTLIITEMDAIVLYPLFFALFCTSVSSRHLYKAWTNCTEIPFGFTGIKVPVCKTFLSYSLTKPALVTCQIGKVDSKTADKLRQAFSGILVLKQHSPSRGHAIHDNDMCCPTTRHLERAPSRMENSYGESRDIVNLPSASLYQFYHAGSCVTSNELKNCHGTCVEEMSTVFLMVFREDLPMGMSFEPFDVPSYCSCKNFGRDHGRNDTSIPTTGKPTERSTRLVHERIKPKITIPPGPIRVHYGKVVSKEMLRRAQPLPRTRHRAAQHGAARLEPRTQLTPAYSTVTPSLPSNNTNENDTMMVPDVTATFNTTVESNLTTNVTTT